jgi:enoyl-CoA hydratase/carnithine racemase
MELRATKYHVDGHVAVVQLSRPHRRNAWTGRMHTEFRWCAAQAESNPQIRALVVYGDPAGRAFCVGADSEALAGHVDHGGYRDGLPEAIANPGYSNHPYADNHFIWQLALRIPIIVAMNGACAGVGLAVAAYSDIRFVAHDAVLTTAAPKLGLPAEYGLSWLLPRLIPRLHATDLLLSGRRWSGTEAEAAGFAFASSDAHSCVEDALAYAHRLVAEASPTSLQMTKRQLLLDVFRHDVSSSIDESVALLDEAMRGADYREGVAALRERRPPQF